MVFIFIIVSYGFSCYILSTSPAGTEGPSSLIALAVKFFYQQVINSVDNLLQMLFFRSSGVSASFFAVRSLICL